MTSLRAALSLVDSAVLAPIYRDPRGRLRLVFIRRGPHGIHGGQIAFPGGRREPEDPDLLATALREAEEEVGLEPGRVEILAALPVIETMATGFRVAPFLGRLNGAPPTWRRQETEIDEILEVPLEDLTRPDAHAVEYWQLPGWPATARSTTRRRCCTVGCRACGSRPKANGRPRRWPIFSAPDP